MGGRGDGPELADGPRFRRFCGGGSHAGVLRCLALRGSQTRPVEAILEICAMAQSSSHMSFACLQMPDELSALIQGIVRERVRRNWPLVLAFEIRAGRRELRQGEFVAVMPCALTNAQYDGEPLWLGKGAGCLGSGGRDAQSIQCGCSTTLSEGPPAGLKPAALRLFAHLPLLRQDSISIPSIFPHSRQPPCSRHLTATANTQLCTSHVLNAALRSAHACICL